LIFLTNKFTRYCIALRNYIQHSVLKNGIKNQHLSALRIICKAEVILGINEESLYNAEKYLFPLLFSVYIAKNKNFKFKLKIKNNIIINIKALEILILEICSSASFIEICLKNGNIIIKSDCKNIKHSRIIVKKLKGCVYYERKKRNVLIAIPVALSEKEVKTNTYKTTEDYLSNPLSNVNVFIN